MSGEKRVLRVMRIHLAIEVKMKKCPSFAGIQKVLPELYNLAAAKQDLFEGFLLAQYLLLC